MCIASHVLVGMHVCPRKQNGGPLIISWAVHIIKHLFWLLIVCLCWRGQTLNTKKNVATVKFKSPTGTLTWLVASSACCLTSMWSAFPWSGSHFWPLTQLVSQRSPIHLQCFGSAPHPDQVEASSIRQQGLVLCQPVPRLLLPQQSHPRPGALLQVEDSHCGLWRQHRYRYS